MAEDSTSSETLKPNQADRLFAVAKANADAISWGRAVQFAHSIGAQLPPEENLKLTESIIQMMATLQGKSVEETRHQNILDLAPEGSDTWNALNDLVKSLKAKEP